MPIIPSQYSQLSTYENAQKKWDALARACYDFLPDTTEISVHVKTHSGITRNITKGGVDNIPDDALNVDKKALIQKITYNGVAMYFGVSNPFPWLIRSDDDFYLRMREKMQAKASNGINAFLCTPDNINAFNAAFEAIDALRAEIKGAIGRHSISKTQGFYR